MDFQVRQATYRPELYDVASLEEAKQVIVTDDGGTTTGERWEKETPYVAEEIIRHLGIGPETTVLDYGCGIGRIAKELIDRTGCRVIGVDFSKSMRLFAPEYVLSERFTVWSPEVLAKMVESGFRVQRAICIWVLLHVQSPAEVVSLLNRAMSSEALLYVLNCCVRCVPTNLGYGDDGIDVATELKKSFAVVRGSRLPLQITTQMIAEFSEVYVLRKT